MTPEELQRWKALEVNTRRSRSDAFHWGDCPTLKIRGVAWRIPPRGRKLIPQFKDGELQSLSEPDDAWPQADELLRRLPLGGEIRECSQCGQPLPEAVEVEIEGHTDFIRPAYSLIAKLLRAQYRLTDQQLGELLASGEDDSMGWFSELLAWCHDGQPRIPEIDVNLVEQVEDAEPAPQKRPWWRRR